MAGKHQRLQASKRDRANRQLARTLGVHPKTWHSSHFKAGAMMQHTIHHKRKMI